VYFRIRKNEKLKCVPYTVILQQTTKKLNSYCDSERLYLNRVKYTQTLNKSHKATSAIFKQTSFNQNKEFRSTHLPDQVKNKAVRRKRSNVLPMREDDVRRKR
jgi:hypothetical protein